MFLCTLAGAFFTPPCGGFFYARLRGLWPPTAASASLRSASLHYACVRAPLPAARFTDGRCAYPASGIRRRTQWGYPSKVRNRATYKHSPRPAGRAASLPIEVSAYRKALAPRLLNRIRGAFLKCAVRASRRRARERTLLVSAIYSLFFFSFRRTSNNSPP